eukprot:Lankesteria_metandrocarpae@DN7392_c0_g1_i1.p1
MNYGVFILRIILVGVLLGVPAELVVTDQNFHHHSSNNKSLFTVDQRMLPDAVKRMANVAHTNNNTQAIQSTKYDSYPLPIDKHYTEGGGAQHRVLLDATDDKSVEGAIVLLLFIWITDGFIQFVLSFIPRYGPPVSVIWFLWGAALGAIFNMAGGGLLGNAVRSAATVPSDVLYFGFLPILLYEATQTVNWHMLKRFLPSGILLAVVGVGLQVGLIGVAIRYAFSQTARLTWPECFLIGSMVASTDPVAVISVLRSAGAPEKLVSMFDGESLINDASSVLLFQLFLAAALGNGDSTPPIWASLLLSLAGPLIGFSLAFVVYVWMSFFRRAHV